MFWPALPCVEMNPTARVTLMSGYPVLIVAVPAPSQSSAFPSPDSGVILQLDRLPQNLGHVGRAGGRRDRR